MANIILPQVEILTPDNLNEDATILIEQDEEIKRFQIANLQTNINVYERETDDFNPDNVELPLEIKQGDILILTNSQNIKSAYYWYQDDWVACDGNVDASKVIMPFDITLAGSYTKVGNLSKDEKGIATFETKGKSVAATLQEILSKREQPKITSNPSVSLTSTSGAKEVGTKITPTWSATFNAGAYTYGPATGVIASEWEISDGTNTASTASGEFPEIIVSDNTNYKITAKVIYTEGAIAKDNLGDPSNPVVQITANSTSKTGSAITGYRSWFMYIGTDCTSAIDTNFIRTYATNKGASPSTQNNVRISQGTKRVLVAIPANSKNLTSVIDIDGMQLDIIEKFVKTSINIEGSNGYNAITYNVWVIENPNGLAETKYNFIIN